MGNNYHRNEETGLPPNSCKVCKQVEAAQKKFMEVEDNKRATGRGKKPCKFYYELGNILGYKPRVNLVATASNSGQSEITDEKRKV